MKKLAPLASVFASIALAATVACSGAIDDAATSAPPNATTAPAIEPASEQASDPGAESTGEDPFFAANTPPPAEEASSPPPAEGSGAEPKAAAELLVVEAARQISAMKVTAYEHTTAVDESTGTFKYDCSGFVGYALTRVLPAQLAAVKAFGGVVRPLAMHYETFFESIAPGASKGGWSRVARAVDARPGDVVAWLKPAELVSSNTGHVMIVTGAATINPKRADEILIPVTDSTSSFHGPADTRYPSADGLGRGAIGIIVDAAGNPLRYRWTGGYSTKEYTTAISFGRPS
jgi:cell wall-associated NlpC family hydrolase